MTFNATKEVLDAMPATIKTAAKRSCTTAATATWDTMSSARFGDHLADMVGIETFIGDQGARAQPADVAFDHLNIVVAAAMQAKRNRTSEAIHQSGDLGVEPPLV